MAEASTKPKSTRAQDETALKIEAIRKQVEFQRKQDEAQLKLREQQAQNALKQQALQKKAELAQRGFQEDQVLQAGENQLMDQAAAADEGGRPLPEIPDPGQLNMADPLGGLARQPGLGAGGFLEAAQQLSGGAGAQQRLAQMQGRGAGGGGQVTIGGQQYPTSGGTIDTTTTETTARPANALEILFGKGPGMVQTGQTTRVTSEPDVLTQYQQAQLRNQVEQNAIQLKRAQAEADDRIRKAQMEEAKLRGTVLGGGLAGGDKQALAQIQELSKPTGVPEVDEFNQNVVNHAIAYANEYQLGIEKALATRTPRSPSAIEQNTMLQRELRKAVQRGDKAAIADLEVQLESRLNRDVVVDSSGVTYGASNKLDKLSKEARDAEVEFSSSVLVDSMATALTKGLEAGTVPYGVNRTAAGIAQAIRGVGESSFVQDLPGMSDEDKKSFIDKTRELIESDVEEYGTENPDLAKIRDSLNDNRLTTSEALMRSLNYQIIRMQQGARASNQDYLVNAETYTLGSLRQPRTLSGVLGPIRSIQQEARSRRKAAQDRWNRYAPGRELTVPEGIPENYLTRDTETPAAPKKSHKGTPEVFNSREAFRKAHPEFFPEGNQ